MSGISPTTFMLTLNQFPFFGQLHPDFNPFKPFESETASIRLFAGPQYEEEGGEVIGLKVRRSRISHKRYVFYIWRTATESQELRLYPLSFPEPGSDIPITSLSVDGGVENFEVDTSHEQDYDFNILIQLRGETC